VGSKTLYYVNSQQAGQPAKELRRKNYVQQERQHPMATELAPGYDVATAGSFDTPAGYSWGTDDYFRTALGRYHTFRLGTQWNGSVTKAFQDFGYLWDFIPVTSTDSTPVPEAAPAAANHMYIGAHIDDWHYMSLTHDTVAQPQLEHFLAYAEAAYSDDLALLTTALFRPGPYNATVVEIHGSSHTFAELDTTIDGGRYHSLSWQPGLQGHYLYPGQEQLRLTVSGSAHRWSHISDNSAVPTNFERLFDKPFYRTWQTYVLGSHDIQLQDSNVYQALNSKMPGLLPHLNGPSTVTPRGNAGQDYHFIKVYNFEPDDHQGSPRFNYINYYLAELSSTTGGILPASLPNLYVVLSATQTGESTDEWAFGYFQKGLYSDNTSANWISQLATYDESYDNEGDSTLYINSILGSQESPQNYLSQIYINLLSISPASLNRVADRTEHVGISCAAMQFLEPMNAHASLFPFDITLTLPNTEESELGRQYGAIYETPLSDIYVAPDQRETYMRGAFYDYFLFEIMKANILNFTSEPLGTDPDPPSGKVYVAADWAGWDSAWAGELYQSMAMTTMVQTNPDNAATPKPRIYGLEEWTGSPVSTGENSDFVSAGSAVGYSSLRTIDVKNILRHGIGMVSDTNPDQEYGDNHGTTGLVGQTSWGGVVDSKGIIIGRDASSGGGNNPTGEPIFGWAHGMNPIGFQQAYTDFITFLADKSQINHSTTQAFTNWDDPAWESQGWTRNYLQLLSGIPAKTDPIAYKICKHSVSPAGDVSTDPIQSFYLPAVGGDLSYHDTQVYFGEKYVYRAYAYLLVFGNEYEYGLSQVYPPVVTAPYPSRIAEAALGFNGPCPMIYDGPEIQDVEFSSISPTDSLINQGQSMQVSDTASVDDPVPWIAWLKQYGIIVGNEQPYFGSQFTSTPAMQMADNPTSWGWMEMFDWAAGHVATQEPSIYIGESGEGGNNWSGWAHFTLGYSFYLDYMNSNGQQLQKRIGSLGLHNPFVGPQAPYDTSNQGQNYEYASIRNLLVGLNLSNSDISFAFLTSGDPASSGVPDLGDGQPGDPADSALPGSEPTESAGLGTPTMRGSGRFLIASRKHLATLTKNQRLQVMFLLNQLAPGFTDLFPAFQPPAPISVQPIGGSPPPPPLTLSTDQSFTYFWGMSSYFGVAATDWRDLASPTVLQFRSGPHGFEPQIPWDMDQAGTAEVTIDNGQSMKIVEIPYAEFNDGEPILVHDLPPVPPDFIFYPTKGVNNKVKILLNQNNIQYEAPGVPITDGDLVKFDEIKQNQNRPDDLIRFGSDDDRIRFEVFRTTTKPVTYRDFDGKKTHVIEGRTNETGIRVTSAAIIDKIEPNVTYYYCFRTIDWAMYPSNPTGVIQVRLIDDNGRMYFISEPYVMVPLPIGKEARTFRKYIEIDAAMNQKYITNLSTATVPTSGLPSAGNLDELPECMVGPDDGVFQVGTTEGFKVRLTGVDTGRMIDLNIKFNVEPVINPKLPEEN